MNYFNHLHRRKIKEFTKIRKKLSDSLPNSFPFWTPTLCEMGTPISPFPSKKPPKISRSYTFYTNRSIIV